MKAEITARIFLLCLLSAASVTQTTDPESSAASSMSCSRRRWCSFITHCLNESLSMLQWNSPNAHGCVMKASGSPDDLVTQWNEQTGVCSIFHYQHVCVAMQTVSAVNSTHSALCSVFRTAAFVSCDASLNSAFLGVWLAGGSQRLSNLVCQGDAAQSRMQTFNLQWGSEGAIFDGVSSYALINDTRFVVSSGAAGFTWLMRLKRQPQNQPFMEAARCTDFAPFGPLLWEFNQANRLYFYSDREAPQFFMFSALNLLPNDTETWVNVGVAVGSAPENSSFIFNSTFAPPILSSVTAEPQFPCYIMLIGHRYGGPAFLKGTVRAVAIAKGVLTAAEIGDFFDLLLP